MTDLLTTDEAAQLLAVAPKTLRKWRYTGGGPMAVKLGPSRTSPVRYRRRDLERWLSQRVESRTHERAS